MKIFLHVGAHRTGTTALQSLLQSHRASLERQGIAFWGPKRTRSGLMSGLIKNTDFIAEQDVALGERSCGRIAMEVSRLVGAGRHSLVLSEENMLGTMVENLESCRLYGQAQSRLARFGPAFDQRNVQIWVSIRDYHLHWASQLAFRIKAGALAPSQAEIDALAAQRRRWSDVIRSVQQAMPLAQVIVWRFEDWIDQPLALLERLLGHKIDLPHFSGFASSNRSMTVEALVAVLFARGDISAARRIAQSNGSERYMPFSAAQQAALQENYRDDHFWLCAGAGGRATYLDPTEGTFGGCDLTKGSFHEREEKSLAIPR